MQPDPEFRIFIENEAGVSIKNTYDEQTLRFLFASPVSGPYPYPYGFALDTTSGDGDAVDCFIVTEQRIKPGEIVVCNPVHLLEQIEDGEVDHKVLCVTTEDGGVVTGEAVQRIREFLATVFSHVPGKQLRTGALLGKTEAVSYLLTCRRPD